MNKTEMLYKIKSVVIGHAIGDALGVPVEFMSREELKEKPVVDMQGYGTFPVPKGAWSDDTSMSICALDAFDEGKLNFDKVMLNFARWYYQDAFTPTGEMFDIGNTCIMAIERYMKENMSWRECGLCDEYSNGNGSLMRIHPFVLYTYLLDTNIKTKVEIIELASALTHAHPRSKIACGIYAFVLWELLDNAQNGCGKEAVRTGLKNAKNYYQGQVEFELHFAKLYQIADSNSMTEEDINSDGYVVHTLEAAIWCLLNTDSYKECVLKAVNVGDDTDTTAAIAGGLAGAMYGYDYIPKTWRETLIKREYIEGLCEELILKV